MIVDFIASALPLAATDDPGLLQSILSQVFLWLKVAIGIGLVIFVHELGHFLAAKSFGVKCEKFYIGFDVPLKIGPIKFPRTLGKFQYGETEYGIGILPLGGYVKMLGQDDDPRKAEAEAKRIRTASDNEDEDEGGPVALDPRSYPAKPVWQRMIIISAGVFMNGVTGILFAAIAYGFGVPYTPAVVGGVTPAGPAWQAGIEPGARVMAVGDLEDDERLHFNEMRLEILTESMSAPDQPVNVSLRYGDRQVEHQLRTQPHPAEPSMRMIGISSGTAAKINPGLAAVPGSAADGPLGPEDRGASVLAFNGTPIDSDAIVPTVPLLDFIHSQPAQPVTLRLRRTDGSERDVEIPPQPEKTLGLRFEVGPVTALVDGGPAETAGIQLGDVITAINGEETIDAYTLALDPITSTGPVTLTIRRKSDASAADIAAEAGDQDQFETQEITITPVQSEMTLPPVSEIGSQIASNSLGLAYELQPIISSTAFDSVSPSDSNQDLAGEEQAAGEPQQDAQADESLRSGDVLREVFIRWPEGKVPDELAQLLPEPVVAALSEGWEVGPQFPLTTLLDTIQLLPVGTKVRVLATRPPDGHVIETTLTVAQGERFWYDRGIGLSPTESIQQAASFGEAMALGWREGTRRLGDVYEFLRLLVRGRVPAKFVSGPIRIVQMAGMQAERGISQQLLFLTMLSMNLAILNFLPIPALDGGHMVFLLAEAIRGRRVDEQLEMKLTLAGVLALLALMVFVFANDIIQSS